MKIRVKAGERLVSRNSNAQTSCFELEAGAYLELTQITLTDRDISQEFEIILLGEQASCELYFLDYSRNNSKLETKVKVIHEAKNCRSRQLHKGLYADQSKGSLEAFIHVKPQAIGTDAAQLHRSLLLSPDAISKPAPHLQIETDAVLCKHGVSIGHLDPQAIFYLRARGLSQEFSKRILIHAFAQEITNRVPDFQHEALAWI